jgi:hypothetical protein
MTEDRARYILETVLDRDDPPEVQALRSYELTAWLAEDIEHQHYTGDGHDKVSIWR